MTSGPEAKPKQDRILTRKLAILSFAVMSLIAAAHSLTSLVGTSNHAKTVAPISVQAAKASFELSPTALVSDSAESRQALLPYSVIPGGVHSALDLRNAVSRDPLVAAHYGDFDLAKARIAPVEQDRLVYVSYRIAGNIFWTSKKLALSKGETVITDGIHEARTRCGNRISETPEGPVSRKEPSAAVLGRAPAEVLPSIADSDSDRASNGPLPLALPRTFSELLPEEGFASPSNVTSAEGSSIPDNGTISGGSESPYGLGGAPIIVGGIPSGSLPLTNSSSGSGSSGSSGSGSTGSSGSGGSTGSTGSGSTGSSGSGGSTGSTGSSGSSDSGSSGGSTPVSTPEPGSLLLLATGIGALGALKIRVKRQD